MKNSLTITIVILFIMGVFNVWSQTLQPHLVVSMTKTPCFGQCVAFDFELYSDCTVTFNGTANTDMMGQWESKATKRQFDNIIKYFEESDFFDFKDRYYAEFSDLPTTYLYFSDDKTDKKIMDYYGAPQKLKNLEAKVEEFIYQMKWKKQKSTNKFQ